MSNPTRSDMTEPKRPVAALVIDMDGVIWRGSLALPGVDAFFALLHSQHIPFMLATNNASQSPKSYSQRLEQLGLEVDPSRILTSGLASSMVLPSYCPAPGPIFIIGTEELRNAFRDRGYEIVDQGSQARAVVVGFDWDLTYYKLAEAALALGEGAFFMGTNPDTSFPAERGLMPGNGALLAALKAATGKEPLVVGKPEARMYTLALEELGTQPDQTMAIGDRLETDILGGERAGLQTALILTGVSSRDDLATSPCQPDYIFADLNKLTAHLEALWLP